MKGGRNFARWAENCRGRILETPPAASIPRSATTPAARSSRPALPTWNEPLSAMDGTAVPIWIRDGSEVEEKTVPGELARVHKG